MSSRKGTPITTTPGVSFVLPDLPHTPSNIHVPSSNGDSSNTNTNISENTSSHIHTTPSNDHGLTSTSSIHRNNSKTKRESNIRLHRNLLATPAALNMTICDTSHVGEDNSLMLLPPSQTISESLTALAHSTSRELEVVWDEIGLSPEERADQLTDLLLNFRSACEQKVKSEREVANNYRQMIVSYKDEIRATSLALKVEADEALLQPRVEPGAGNGNMNGNGNGNGNNNGNSNQMTLQDEVYTLEVALEDLRYVAQVAQKELTRCKDLLVEYHEALGISMEEDWNDISSDMTKPRIALFQAKVEEMEAMVTTRSSAVVQLIRDCQELIDALRISVDASSTERSSTAGGIRNMDENDDTSLSNSDLDRKIMQSLIKDKDGNIKIVSFIETDECTGISANTLDALTKRVSELHAEKRKRKAKLAEMGAIIGELWEKLHVPNDEQRAFAEGINGLGEETLAKGEKEIARLYQMKEAMMGRLIADCRKRIHDLWAETNATDSQKSSFNNSMNVQDEALFNDDLLSKHENYATLLEQRLEQMRPILDMVAKREVVVEERMQYEEFLKDPNRLQQRGAALTQQLMKEEKMSRRIKKDLPKYTEVITRKLKEWANDHNEPFLYNGEDYLEVMNRQEIQWQEYKENQAMIKRQKKQQERTVYSNTSSSSTGGYQSKGFSSKNTGAPLADKTNSGPAERSKKARPFSRLRAMSRTRERGGNLGTTTQNKDPRGNPSRGKVRGNTSRTRGILSRGRAKPLTRN